MEGHICVFIILNSFTEVFYYYYLYLLGFLLISLQETMILW